MDRANLTQVLALRAASWRREDIPEPARELARQCVLDYFGVALAGAGDELVRLLIDEMNESGGAPQASVIGLELRLPALSAALVNGAAAHALDYDDVNMAMPGHPCSCRIAAQLGPRGRNRLCRRLRDRLPHRRGTAAGALQSRLSLDRHD